MRRLLQAALPGLPYPFAGTPAPCALCGGTAATVIARLDRRLKPLTTVACTGCGLIRTDPMPTEAELAAYYTVLYRLDYQLAGRGPSRAHLGRGRREAAGRLALLAPALPRGARVLDFGCGSGEFLAALAAAGHAPLGLEPGADYAAAARRRYGVPVLAASLGEAEFPARSFDAITAHHVIEHLRDPVAALARLAGWLRADGVLYVSVPDLSPSDQPPFARLHFAHVHNFVPATLLAAARRAGLEPDPRFPPQGTTLVLRHAAAGPATAAEVADPARAATIIAGLPDVSPLRHALSLRWVGRTARKARRWISNTAGGCRRPPRSAAAAPRKPASLAAEPQ
ncbi:class I SAM-dependent methyltransferase [Roseicella aquatilis]|uniref:Class I SAM-dependent methyltransferase n=1 Tax=Roseicella aquatilis TaxID=2527868 RepID=A0A4V2WM74_9PROT|nr:class I SAM-dependent methyltransferase [Roseicella aquatilis]TCZ66172.1 class I SAM-dependent methyltransferase [Roseicella aquatilis]